MLYQLSYFRKTCYNIRNSTCLLPPRLFPHRHAGDGGTSSVLSVGSRRPSGGRLMLYQLSYFRKTFPQWVGKNKHHF
jgi:hypothetical protein